MGQNGWLKVCNDIVILLCCGLKGGGKTPPQIKLSAPQENTFLHHLEVRITFLQACLDD